MNLAARRKYLYPAIWLWLVVCVLYAPAWRAGFVTDAIDWLHDIQTLPFGDYLSRSRSTIHALYQTTQLVTFGFYKLFGTARLPWHLLFTTMQAGAAYLLYLLCGNLFKDASLRRPRRIAFWGAIIFCVSPYCSEVVVWKACFHYLQGLLLMLGVLRCVQEFIYTPRPAMSWLAILLFAVSSFALEVFYLTPLFTAMLLIYYWLLGWNKTILRNAWRYFVVSQVVVFILHLLLLHGFYGEWASHGTAGAWALPLREHLINGARYAFHLVLWGRYWPQPLKEKAYSLCENTLVLCVGYALLFGMAAWAFRRARRGYGREQIVSLLLYWVVLAVLLALAMPLERLFDLSGNRYLYLAVAFGSMLTAVVVDGLPRRWAVAATTGVILGISGFLTLRTSRHWQTSERINSSLLQSFPPAAGRTTILLSMPYCYKGIPMINAWPYGNFQRMHDVLCPPALPGKIWDGAAFNMASPADGSEVEVVNDSTVKVTLKQWGTWWWYQDFGAYNYQTADYRIDMRDPGHWYELTLKQPFNHYQLLYQTGDKWQVVTR